MNPISGWAAGVPYTALPPAGRSAGDRPLPLVIAWHMMDPPRSDDGFAALMPLSALPAWRVYLGMPRVGRRAVEGMAEAVRADPMLRYIAPVVQQATGEFPAALDEIRRQFPGAGGPLGLAGASLGGTVALHVLATLPVPVAAVALVNPAIRAATAVEMVAAAGGVPYPWNDESRAAADRLDLVARAGAIAARDPQPALLVVSGEEDNLVSRTDAADLTRRLTVNLTSVPGLAHSLAEGPAAIVDDAVTAWFQQHLIGR